MWFRLVRAFGFDDGKHGLSFNKMVTFTALWAWTLFLAAIVWLSWHGKTLPPASLVAIVAGISGVIIGAGFGLKGYIASRKGAPNE